MKDNRTASLVVSLILILIIASACQPARPAAPAPTDAVPVAAVIQPTPTMAPTSAPTATPTEGPALNPSARGYVSMSYDSESDKIILFGGQIEGRGIIPNGETWAYDVASNTWTEMMSDTGPAMKAAVDLVYDAESDRVILFGGGGEQLNVMSDTWAYDYNTNTWTEMAAGPEDHLGYRMAYDIESDRCILFGGMGYPSLSLFNDTWAYDFNSDTWTEMQPSTSPSARNFHAMAYDAQADRVVLFGGSEWDENMSDKAMRDTWAYDFNTNTWQELEHGEGEYPPARLYHAMVYDPEQDRTILFGDNYGGTETWSYDYSTSTWTKLEPSPNPGVLYKHAMAYSTAAGLLVLFGGQPTEVNFDFTDQTWIYDPKTNTWTDMTRSP